MAPHIVPAHRRPTLATNAISAQARPVANLALRGCFQANQFGSDPGFIASTERVSDSADSQHSVAFSTAMRANQHVADDRIEKQDRGSARDKRRGEALRANLKRRKAQRRGRTDQDKPADQNWDGGTDVAKEER